MVAAGVLDLLVGYLLICPKVEDPRTRKILMNGFVVSGFLMAVLGAAFLLGAFELD